MKIAVYSDLHTEFDRENNLWIPPPVNADVIVFAGDIGTAPGRLDLYAGLVEKAHPNVDRFLYIAGNHEWYSSGVRFGDSGYDKYRQKFRRHARSTFLEMESLKLGGVTFMGCTLWSNMSATMADTLAQMNDYSRIRIDRLPYRKVRASDITARWKRSVIFLEQHLALCEKGRTVVITHHSPTRSGIAAPHGDTRLMPAYASDLDSMIEKLGPALWIHGHVHQKLDRVTSSTRLVCNPRGYNTIGPDGLVPTFDPTFVIDV